MAAVETNAPRWKKKRHGLMTSIQQVGGGGEEEEEEEEKGQRQVVSKVVNVGREGKEAMQEAPPGTLTCKMPMLVWTPAEI